MSGPTREQVRAVIDAALPASRPTLVPDVDAATDAVMALLADTAPEVLWEAEVRGMIALTGEEGQVEDWGLQTVPLTPGTRVAVIASPVVAGEPESAPAAELPVRSYPEFLRRFLPEEAERRRSAGMTPSEVAQEIGREAAAEALAAFTRAADTQEAGDA